MLSRLDLRGADDLASRIPRPERSMEAPVEQVRSILADVRSRGDDALRDLTLRLDGVDLGELRVGGTEMKEALASIPSELKEALEAARDAIVDYQSRRPPLVPPYRRNGLTVEEIRRPVDRAGLYVPGGRASYPSTVLMTAIPAQVAGVASIALCVPPGPDGSVAAETLAAAQLLGVEEVYRVGGAQAIGALAFGTQSIPPVDVIAGPGNIYVSIAQREVSGLVGVPSCFSGPSEVVVVADDSTPPELAAIDVVVQAEHGPDGLAWLVTWSARLADAVSAEVSRLVSSSPRCQELESTLSRGGYAVLVDGPAEAAEVANVVAPEHLEIMSEDPDRLVPLVRNAGAVFTGIWAPASVGDYLAGPSHVLPTFGSARFASALGVDDFVKRIHVVSLDGTALRQVEQSVAVIAEAEGLVAHAESVRARRKL